MSTYLRLDYDDGHPPPTELADKDNRSDAAYFLDMDLSILGMPWPEYEHYAQAIRQEYAHVPMTDYKTGRTAGITDLAGDTRACISLSIINS